VSATDPMAPSSVDPRTGLEFYDLSHEWGHDAPLWPYFPDVKIERFHYHAKSGVLSQQITTFMHCTTHTDAPAHVIAGAPSHPTLVPGSLYLSLRKSGKSSRRRILRQLRPRSARATS